MKIILKYRFFILIGMSVLLNLNGADDLASISFFIAILDLANVMSKSE
tara:strand:- start:495 stop:638 length:144 start_codon:yes stop_codon:yes gene_type:complete